MKKNVFFIASLLLAFCNMSATNHHDEFFDYVKSKDTVKARNVLLMWEKEDPKSADLYAAWFNYYYWTGMTESIGNSVNLPDGVDDYMPLTDSTGATAGYLYSVVTYCKDSIDLAFRKIDQGLALNPQRLDLHFGRIHVMLQMSQNKEVSVCGNSQPVKWEKQTTTKDVAVYLCKLVDTPDMGKWLWKNGEKMDDSESFFYDNMQSYFVELVNSGDVESAEIFIDKLLSKKKTLEFRADKGSLLALKNDYDGALALFLGVHNDFPDDGIVISNIASCYEKKGDTKNAIKYYEKMAKLKDKEAREFANKALKQLKGVK